MVTPWFWLRFDYVFGYDRIAFLVLVTFWLWLRFGYDLVTRWILVPLVYVYTSHVFAMLLCPSPKRCPRIMASSSSLWRRRASGKAELALLLDLAQGKKTYEDVKTEAERYAFEAPALRKLIGTNSSRTVQSRLETLTGISKDALTYFDIRRKGEGDEAPLPTKRHPFHLLTSTIKRRLQSDPEYFEVGQKEDQPDTVASSFTNSPEYTCHELVQDCASRGEMVIPIGIYGDGIAVGVDVYQDSLIAIYIYFPHRGVEECRKPGSKHTFTVYRKSEATPETVDDIWNVLLWELQALASGREPRLGEQTKPLECQDFSCAMPQERTLISNI